MSIIEGLVAIVSIICVTLLIMCYWFKGDE